MKKRNVGHFIRVLLTGELIDGRVQNGGWRRLWVEDDKDEWVAVCEAVGDVRRVVCFEQMTNVELSDVCRRH